MIGFTLYLSIAAITITGAVLLQADRDTAAIQAKLDQLILASKAANDLIGLNISNLNRFTLSARNSLHRYLSFGHGMLRPIPR